MTHMRLYLQLLEEGSDSPGASGCEPPDVMLWTEHTSSGRNLATCPLLKKEMK